MLLESLTTYPTVNLIGQISLAAMFVGCMGYGLLMVYLSAANHKTWKKDKDHDR
jgi:hypothetical protein